MQENSLNLIIAMLAQTKESANKPMCNDERNKGTCNYEYMCSSMCQEFTVEFLFLKQPLSRPSYIFDSTRNLTEVVRTPSLT